MAEPLTKSGCMNRTVAALPALSLKTILIRTTWTGAVPVVAAPGGRIVRLGRERRLSSIGRRVSGRVMVGW